MICATPGTAAADAVDLEQRRLRGHVVVPEVVVHGLEVPAHLAGRRRRARRPSSSSSRGRCARRRSSPATRCRSARRRGRARRRPRGSTRRSACRPCTSRPRCAAPSRANPAAPDPRPSAARRCARRRRAPRRPARRLRTLSAHQRADDDEVADHQRRRRHVVLPGRHVADALAQRDAAARAEVGARDAGLGVERDQLRVDRAGEDAALRTRCPRASDCQCATPRHTSG